MQEFNTKQTVMTDEEVILTNEKRKFKLVMEMLKQIERVSFETEIGQQLHTDLVICISEVIRPIVKEKANHLIEQ